jgi:2-oxoglutarate dehydrogenase E2 component (dihydrolipoamide succinyltransferase)
MAVDVIMPQMGESIFEGTITKWLKKPGDKVERDEPLFEISTDKVDAEIPAPAAGVLKEIKINEGQTVPIQTVVAVIDVAGAATTAAPAAAPAAPAKAEAPPTAAKPAAKSQAPAPAAAKESASSAAKKDSAAVLAASSAAPAEAEAPAPVPAPTQTTAPDNGKRIHSSPLVRRLARESNIDLSTISGTGVGGRISKNDIQAAIAGGGAKSAPAGAAPAGAAAPSGTAAPTGTTTPAGAPKLPSGPGGQAAQVAIESAVPRERMYFGKYTVQPMSMMRQKIAEHMVASKRVSPHVYSVDEADMTKVAAARAQSKGEFETRYGTKLTFMPFFMRASVEALRAFPTLNSSIDGTNIVLHNDINLGIAVSLENGLIVPVVRNAEEKNFLGLQRSVNDLAERARSKKLKPEEVQDGTFAITNPGIYGGLMGLAVINQPNVAILGIGAIQKRVVVIDDAIAIRSMVYLTLSYDHRVVDGATAHQFIGKLKSVLEEWSEPLV